MAKMLKSRFLADGAVVKLAGLAGGVLAFGIIVSFAEGSPHWLLGAVMALMVIWWVSEAVPLAATALVPLVLLPLLGLVALPEVTPNYTKPIIFLMFAGLTLALAIQRANLHVRIVVAILRITGGRINSVIFGFMLATGLMSMWLSNTATTAAMLPIALSFIAILITPPHQEHKMLPPPETISPQNRKLALTILLGIAYSANIGGTATLIGTVPNALFAGQAAARFAIPIDFLSWTLMVLPWTLIMIVLMWFIMTRILFRNATPDLTGFYQVLDETEEDIGKFSYEEKCVALLFGLTVLFLIFHRFIPLANLNYTIIGIFAVICAFAIPIRFKPLQFMLEWKDMKELPWGVLLLLGGGLALGDGMTKTGFSTLLGDVVLTQFSFFGDSLWFVFAALGLVLTEFASNTAMLATLLPVAFDIAEKTSTNPMLFGVPLTIATSCAFMMPIATPPNALVFASGYIRVSEMARAGIWINVLALALIWVVLSLTIPFFFPQAS